VTKTQYFATSLIAALPAGLLTYTIVMALLSYPLSTMAYVVLVLTLLCLVLVMGFPVVIKLPGRKKPAAAKTELKSAGSEDIESVDGDMEVSEGSSATISASGSFDAQDVLAESSEYDLGNSDLDMANSESLGDDSIVDFDVEDDEEDEPKPKKKKR